VIQSNRIWLATENRNKVPADHPGHDGTGGPEHIFCRNICFDSWNFPDRYPAFGCPFIASL